jgi:hypothetical protein
VLSAFVRLKGITIYSYDLNLVRNTVIYSSPSLILILWKAAVTSSFVYYFARLIWFRVSFISRSRY